MNRRFALRGIAAAATLAAAGAVVACSPPGQGGTSGATEGSAGAAASGDTLVIYSNSVSEGRGDWLSKQAEEAGFALQFVDLGGGDVMNRLVAEKNNPVADVTFGLNNVYFEKLKAADVLEPYTPAWSGDVDAALGDATDKQFWPIVREPIMLVYNTAAYPGGAGAPTDWPDLWTKPEFKQKYETPTSLGGATTQMVLSGILSRYKDPNGELGISAEGWNAVEQYFANGSPAVKGTDLFARMKEGQVNAGQMWLAGKASREKEFGITTQAVNPAVGVPMVVQHVALVKGTKKSEQAQKFIDWFGSPEVQAAWSKQFFTAPTNAKAAATADADAIAQTDAFKRQDIDWPFVAEHIDQWVEKAELEYLG